MTAHSQAGQTPLPAALAEPVNPVSGTWIGLFTAASLAKWIGILGPTQILVPVQIAQIDPANKVASFGWVSALGSIVAVLACPLFGALSDRTTSRFGRRHPWILGGTVLFACALALQSIQDTFFGVLLCWLLVQTTVNALYAGIGATIPDSVPVRQRGFVSAFMGLSMPAGLVLATMLMTVVAGADRSGYLLLVPIVLVLGVPFVLFTKDVPLPASHRPALSVKGFLAGFWISPRKHPDYAWAFSGRFALQLANAIGTLYLLYFLQDEVGLDDPANGVFVLISLYTAAILLTSVIAGRISDRLGRRKVFVLVSGCVVAVAMLMLAFWHTWTAVTIAAVILGSGYGVYVAVDDALITQVLPKARDRGKDLGLINAARTAPVAVAPAVAGTIITLLDSYLVLYLTAGVVALIAALLVQPIKSVR